MTAPGFLAAAGRELRNLGRREVRARRCRDAMTDLARLDNHALADIGIERPRIPLAVDGLLAPRG